MKKRDKDATLVRARFKVTHPDPKPVLEELVDQFLYVVFDLRSAIRSNNSDYLNMAYEAATLAQVRFYDIGEGIHTFSNGKKYKMHLPKKGKKK